MYVGYGMDLGYWGIVIASVILGGLTQAYIQSTYRKWSHVEATAGATGREVARRMLDAEGASAVGITSVEGHLTDFYDPRDNMLHLSEENCEGGSVASVAVACHEAGHAVQTARGYLPGRMRTALVPVVNFAQQIWMIVLIAGLLLDLAGLAQAAIILFALSVVFHLVTLPVEIDASRRAVAYLGHAGTGIDERGARQVLTAAALTYVAAALVSVLQLLYLVGRTGRRE
ncbi:zinc metallopeptidase [Olsenella massiliensis]|uniref:zinc metallopeptidase n=1 Tax=Olsenella massiliensis TaxID=1622075 RepID=UPI00071D4497|nr:zinc metallopeptidase [Olsenella massiliensis]